MSSQAFCHIEGQTPLRECFLVAGVVWEVSTNFTPILDATRQSFPSVEDAQVPADLHLRFWVDAQAHGGPAWAIPYIRGLDHLVFAGFDSHNSLLIDLRNRRAMGRLSSDTAADCAYWKRMIFPLLVGVMGASVGVTALHCGCAARNGKGLLLAGGPGAGKSTLTLALAQRGFAFLSDEWTYFSRRDGQLRAWALPTPLKLLPDTVTYFPELATLEPGVSLHGERAFEVDPERVFGVARVQSCDPRWLFFLDRQENTSFHLSEMPPEEAAARFEGGLLAESPAAMNGQRETIRSLVSSHCRLLRYGGSPQSVARALEYFCENA